MAGLLIFASASRGICSDDIPKVDALEYRSCGVSVLYLSCYLQGITASLDEIAALLKPAADGTTSFDDLDRAATALGMFPASFKLSPKSVGQLRKIPSPAILHVRELEGQTNGNHFVLYLGTTKEGDVLYLDPPKQPLRAGREKFGRLWTGNVLIVPTSEVDRLATLRRISGGWGFSTLAVAVCVAVVGCLCVFKWYRPTSRPKGMLQLPVMCIALSLMLFGGCQRNTTENTSGVLFASDLVDAGIVAPGDEIEIPITNKGADHLDIRQVSTSCVCTVANVPKNIGPGETLPLRIRTPTSGNGPTSSRVLIRSSDSESPKEIYLTWMFRSPPGFVPPKVVGIADSGSTFEAVVRVAFAGGDPRYVCKVKRIACTSPAFSLVETRTSSIAVVQANVASDMRPSVGEIAFRFKCVVPEGVDTIEGNCDVTVEQGGQESVLSLPVNLRVRGAIQSHGTLLFSGNHKDLQGQTRHLVLSCSTEGGSPIVAAAPDFVEVVIKRIERPPHSSRRSTFDLIATLVDKPPSAFKGRLTLRLSNDDKANLHIPITVVHFGGSG